MLTWKLFNYQIFTYQVKEINTDEEDNKEYMDVDEFFFNSEKDVAREYCGKYAQSALNAYKDRNYVN